MADKNINIVVKAKDEASAQINKIGSSMKESFQRASVTAAAAGAVMTSFFASTLKGAAEAESANKQLAHAVMEVSGATKEQLEATSALADQLERKGVLDGDALKLGLAQLSTFGLSNDAVQALGSSMADLAVNQYGVNAGGEELTATANTMAKALNGQFGVLEKSGIRFTEAQQNMIKFGSETEKVTALQEGLAQNLKYTNDVALTTFEGGMAKLKVQMDNVSEAIGTALFPMLQELGNQIMPILSAFQAWTVANPELFNQIVQIAAVLGVALTVFGALGVVLPPIIAGFSALGAVFAFVATTPLGLLVVGIAALTAGVLYLWNTNEGFRTAVLEIWATISGFITQSLALIWAAIDGFLTTITTAWSEDWGGIRTTFEEVWTFMTVQVPIWAGQIVTSIQETFAPLIEFFQEHWDQITAIWNIALLGLQTAWDIFWSAVKLAFQTAWEIIKTAIKVGLAAMKGDWTAAWEAIKSFFIETWAYLTAFAQSIITSLVKFFTESWNQIKQGFTDFASAVTATWNGFWDGMKNTVSQAWGYIKGIIDLMTSAINSAIGSLKVLVGMGGGAAAVGAQGGKKARGGFVGAGNTHLVGEEGPEIFIPNQRGTIIPASKSGGSGSVININVTGNTVLSDDGAEQIGDMIFNRLRLQTKL